MASLLITAFGRVFTELGRLWKRLHGWWGSAVNDTRSAHLRLSPSTAWRLQYLCRSITTILWARPDVRRVCVDLTRIRRLDASSAALLRYALRELERAEVEVDIIGPGSRAARVLAQEGRVVADTLAPRAPSAEPGRTIH